MSCELRQTTDPLQFQFVGLALHHPSIFFLGQPLGLNCGNHLKGYVSVPLCVVCVCVCVYLSRQQETQESCTQKVAVHRME